MGNLITYIFPRIQTFVTMMFLYMTSFKRTMHSYDVCTYEHTLCLYLGDTTLVAPITIYIVFMQHRISEIHVYAVLLCNYIARFYWYTHHCCLIIKFVSGLTGPFFSLSGPVAHLKGELREGGGGGGAGAPPRRSWLLPLPHFCSLLFYYDSGNLKNHNVEIQNCCPSIFAEVFGSFWVFKFAKRNSQNLKIFATISTILAQNFWNLAKKYQTLAEHYKMKDKETKRTEERKKQIDKWIN